ncbi:hypothetical protein [Legionella cardiaca]|uniref:Uncharacterized protein n=1 Tax=Legionella cardiaca TaxID=1071983 RepID=A0ABY8AZS6_9GAMM|nr:hypothetical protein [Legionella cardiaca]WED44602.1 hypothetical protein PXX05_07380 [Legionella cardiaca]
MIQIEEKFYDTLDLESFLKTYYSEDADSIVEGILDYFQNYPDWANAADFACNYLRKNPHLISKLDNSLSALLTPENSNENLIEICNFLLLEDNNWSVLNSSLKHLLKNDYFQRKLAYDLSFEQYCAWTGQQLFPALIGYLSIPPRVFPSTLDSSDRPRAKLTQVGSNKSRLRKMLNAVENGYYEGFSVFIAAIQPYCLDPHYNNPIFFNNLVSIIEDHNYWNASNLEDRKDLIEIVSLHPFSQDNFLQSGSFPLYYEVAKRNNPHTTLLQNIRFFLQLSSESKFRYEAIKSITIHLSYLPKKELDEFVQQLFQDENLDLIQAFYQLHELCICWEGETLETWSMFARSIFFPLTEPECRNSILEEKIGKKPTASREALNHKLKQYNEEVFTQSPFVIPENCTFLRIQGRTILFKDKNEEKIHAIKIQKKGEDAQSLFQQKITVDFLNQNKEVLGLKSEFPEALSLKKMTGLNNYLMDLVKNNHITEQEYTQLMESIQTQNDTHLVYEYSAHPNYFEYLNSPDISMEQAYHGAQAALHDLLVFLDMGIVYDEIIDLFHTRHIEENRTDNGRYLSLVSFSRRHNNWENVGAGRLSGWKNCKWPNIRLTGLADEGDWKNLEEFTSINPSSTATSFFKELVRTKLPNQKNRIRATFVAEAMLCLELCLGMRACRIIEKNPQIDSSSLWLETANCIIRLHIQAFSEIGQIPQEKAREMFLSIIDVERYARQMAYWMGQENIAYSLKGEIKPGIYEPEAKVLLILNEIQTGTFSAEQGWCVDPELGPDLGTFNGPYPIQEAVKGHYALVTLGYVSRALQLKLGVSPKPDADSVLSESVDNLRFFSPLSKQHEINSSTNPQPQKTAEFGL